VARYYRRQVKSRQSLNGLRGRVFFAKRPRLTMDKVVEVESGGDRLGDDSYIVRPVEAVA
jgi:hypothetical protein